MLTKSKILITILIFAFTTLVSAQTASATWPLSNPSSGGTGFNPNVSGLINAANELLKGTEINQYTGANNSQRIRMAGTNNTWPANLIDKIDTVYVQFSVSPKKGITFEIKKISMLIGAASTNYMKARIFYSEKSDFSNPTEINYSTGSLSNFLISGGQSTVNAEINVTINEDETFYLRIYPWNEYSAIQSGKYMTLQNVEISGTTIGNVEANLAAVSTSSASYISTTFATSGGNIINDGGGLISERGICWNTIGNPSTSDDKKNAGSGVGSFKVLMQNLLPATKYYIRAYAVNSAGTSYGDEISFTTLNQKIVPQLTTNSVTNILVKTAHAGGSVTAWGGDSVFVRGVCYSENSNPTVNNFKTINGSDIGSFSTVIGNLKENTKYYLRAYAENSVGVGYGNEVSFTTQSPAVSITKTVSLDGTGDYTTVQSAFDAVPANYTGKYIIFIKNGTYKEKLKLISGKVNVVIRGESRDNTILTYDDYSGKPGTSIGTSTSETLAIQANDVTLENIIVQNTATQAQAVALNITGDRIIVNNCHIDGYQDTYYTWNSGRVYNINSKISGTVDFIFGHGVAVFDNCNIHIKRNTGTLTAAATKDGYKFGYVFLDCKITADSIGYDGAPISRFLLGRPWQNSPRTVFIRCEQPASLNPVGWAEWNVIPALYAEYKCYGPGSDYSQRLTSISRQLTDDEAKEYTITNIFSMSTGPEFGFDWMPEITTSVENKGKLNSEIPAKFSLEQNYPNPFNPTTLIKYQISELSDVTLKVYDLLGREVTTLVNEVKQPGEYSVEFITKNDEYSSGIYFYELKTQKYRAVKKLVLLK